LKVRRPFSPFHAPSSPSSTLPDLTIWTIVHFPPLDYELDAELAEIKARTEEGQVTQDRLQKENDALRAKLLEGDPQIEDMKKDLVERGLGHVLETLGL